MNKTKRESFIEEIISVYKKYSLAIDSQGIDEGLAIVDYTEEDDDHLRSAAVEFK